MLHSGPKPLQLVALALDSAAMVGQALPLCCKSVKIAGVVMSKSTGAVISKKTVEFSVRKSVPFEIAPLVAPANGPTLNRASRPIRAQSTRFALPPAPATAAAGRPPRISTRWTSA